jgi:hypothetical protein
MTKNDEEEFISFFKEADYECLEEKSWQTHYCCGNVNIQFLPSFQYEGVILGGRIAIKTLDKSNDALRCEKLYKKMNNWLKKNYSNNLILYNSKLETKNEAVCEKSWWMSPEVEKELKNGNVILKQSKNSFIVYDLAQ